MTVEQTQEQYEANQALIDILIEQARVGDKALEQEIKKWQANTKLGKSLTTLDKSVSTATKGFKDSATKIAGSTGDFNDLGSAISGVIGAVSGMAGGIVGLIDKTGIASSMIEGLGDAADELITFATAQSQAGFNSFQELAKAGQVGADGITGLAESMEAAGVPLATYTKLLTQNSESMAYFGGTAKEGADKFNAMLKDMKDGNDNQLRHLGYSLEEIGETSITFQKRSQRMGFEQDLSAKQLAKATNQYGKELDLVAKLTGKQRSAIEQERDRLMADDQFRAMLNSLPELTEEAKTKMADSLNQLADPEIAAGVKQIMASGTFVGEQAQKLAIQGSMGQDILSMREDFLSGKMSIQEFNDGLIASAKKNEMIFNDLTRITGESVAVNQAALSDQSNKEKITKQLADKAAETQDKQITATDTATKNLVSTMKEVQEASATMSKMFMATEAGTTALKEFAGVLNSAVQFIDDKFNGPKSDTPGISLGGTTKSGPAPASRIFTEMYGTDEEKAELEKEVIKIRAQQRAEWEKMKSMPDRQSPLGRWIDSFDSEKPESNTTVADTAIVSGKKRPTTFKPPKVVAPVTMPKPAETIVTKADLKETEDLLNQKTKEMVQFDNRFRDNGPPAPSDYTEGRGMIKELYAIRTELATLNSTAKRQEEEAAKSARALENGL